MKRSVLFLVIGSIILASAAALPSTIQTTIPITGAFTAATDGSSVVLTGPSFSVNAGGVNSIPTPSTSGFYSIGVCGECVTNNPAATFDGMTGDPDVGASFSSNAPGTVSFSGSGIVCVTGAPVGLGCPVSPVFLFSFTMSGTADQTFNYYPCALGVYTSCIGSQTDNIISGTATITYSPPPSPAPEESTASLALTGIAAIALLKLHHEDVAAA